MYSDQLSCKETVSPSAPFGNIPRSVSGSFNDEVLVEKDGEDIVIGFNCRYLYDAVKSCDTDEIKLSMSTPLMSMIIEPADASLDETFTFLVLPVRLKN